MSENITLTRIDGALNTLRHTFTETAEMHREYGSLAYHGKYAKAFDQAAETLATANKALRACNLGEASVVVRGLVQFPPHPDLFLNVEWLSDLASNLDRIAGEVLKSH